MGRAASERLCLDKALCWGSGKLALRSKEAAKTINKVTKVKMILTISLTPQLEIGPQALYCPDLKTVQSSGLKSGLHAAHNFCCTFTA